VDFLGGCGNLLRILLVGATLLAMNILRIKMKMERKMSAYFERYSEEFGVYGRSN